MKPGCLSIIVLAFALVFTAAGIGSAAKSRAALPANAKVVVGLALEAVQDADGKAQITANLTIKNTGEELLLVQHPHNRQVVTFLVTNALGNVVAPVALGKADPAYAELELQPGGEAQIKFERLEFISGSAWWGYELESGGTYRVVAVYRPAGKDGPGFCSGEVMITPK